MRVLIVEDHKKLAIYLKRALMEQGYAVDVAYSGREALQWTDTVDFDLIVLDIMLPELDGLTVCRTLRDRGTKSLILMLTARDAVDDRVSGLDAGADDYLIKPFDTRELLVRVRNLIEQRRKLRERFSRGFSGGGEFIFSLSDINITSMEEQFLQKAINIVEEHLAETDFSVEMFGKEIGMSRVQLHRKLRALVNFSASQFIRTLRLNRAAQLLQQHSGNIAEIAYDVGFNNPSYFAECFRKQFGKLPSQYAAQYSQKPL